MADPNALLHEPRRRNLAILAGAALISILLAALALWHQSALLAPKYTPQTYFPGLAAQSPNIVHIRVASTKFGSFDVVFRPETGWVLPGMHDYPANFVQVRKTIVGMSGLETIAPKTARPEWFHYLGLRAPKVGRGVAIALFDDKGRQVAAMIAGKTKSIGEPGMLGMFVRAPDSDQVWLVRSAFTPAANPADWMNKEVVSLTRNEIAEATVHPLAGPSYTVERTKPEQAEFTLRAVPKGRELAYPSAPSGPAASLVDFSFDKAVPSADINFTGAAELETKTFGGLTVKSRITAQGGESWVALSAEADPSNKGAVAQAKKINRAAAAWAFEIPAYKAAQFTTPLENLLKPLAAKAAKKKP